MSIDFYNTNASNFYESTVDVDMGELYIKFTKHLPGNASVLDAGCGSGRDSKAFQAMGFHVTAFDASEEMVKRASQLTGLEVQCKRFDQFQAARNFNGIWACASLLHVPLADLPGVLKKFERMLVVGGVWYMSFKYGSCEREKDGRHFTDLDEKGLEELLRPLNSIQIESMWSTDDVRPGRNEKWLNVIIRKRSSEN